MNIRLVATAAALALGATLLTAQTRIVAPDNKSPVSDDVKLGKEAADEARKQLPLMRDDAVTSYVEDLGRRLVVAIPPEFRHPEFNYTFETINVREINAFALPGGPMFVNRGMIEASNSEGEVAGVMAHEISHVVLRHGTAQAAKAGKYQVGQVAGAILGAVIGGRVGSVVAQGSQFGIGTFFMKFGREYEKQADLAGARIMSLAGYDPREMASMFKTIEKEGGSNGPEWMSSHPNPGNRSEYIAKEALALPVRDPITASAAYDRVRAHLRTLPKAPTTEEATKNAKKTGGSTTSTAPSGRVDPPATRYQTYTEGNIFQISVPSNWREMTSTSSVTFAPQGAYGTYQGQSVFTHGVEAGIARSHSSNLRDATDAFIDDLRRSNQRMSLGSGYQNISIDGRRALQTSIGNVSDATGQNEIIQLVTLQMRDGNLFYAITVAPREDIDDYQATFQRVLSSLRVRN
ncbi:MAG: M48 family metallopeptidase [Vicinamibacterales bacterium]